MICTFNPSDCEIKPPCLPEGALESPSSEQENQGHNARDRNQSINTAEEIQIQSITAESVNNCGLDTYKCKGCGQPKRRHATGFCRNCRTTTVEGKQAMRLYNNACAARQRDDKRKAGTYDEWNKRNMQRNLKRQRSIKENDPERYKREFLDPKIAHYADVKLNNPIAYQRERDRVKALNDRVRNERDLAWIAYIEQHRSRCTREGCDITTLCCIQFNHTDTAKKKFNMSVNEFGLHKQGTSAEWKAEQEKVEALCAFHHIDVTCSHTPKSVDARKRRAVKQFKLAAKSCAACSKTIQLSSPGFVEPAELAKFHVDHISRGTRTTQQNHGEHLDLTDVGLQLLCVHCHFMKTTGENYNMFETVLSTYLWNNLPLWFRTWFAINTKGEDWKERREDFIKKIKEGTHRAEKRQKVGSIKEEESSEDENGELMMDETDFFET